MKEVEGDFWKLVEQLEPEAVCVTTNGVLNSMGQLVVGKGIAREMADRYPMLPRKLGEKVRQGGNHVYSVICDDRIIVSFPTKHHWREKSDIELIRRSAVELLEKTGFFGYQTVLMPKPGCGCGGLKWGAVKAVIEPILDDRFIIVL